MAQNRWRNWLKNKGKQINFWDALTTHRRHRSQLGDSTDMRNTLCFERITMTHKACLDKKKNRLTAFLRPLQVPSKNGETVRKGLWMGPIQSRSPEHRRWALVLVTSLLNSEIPLLSMQHREKGWQGRVLTQAAYLVREATWNFTFRGPSEAQTAQGHPPEGVLSLKYDIYIHKCVNITNV